LPHNYNNNNDDDKNYNNKQSAGPSAKEIKRTMGMYIGHRKLDMF